MARGKGVSGRSRTGKTEGEGGGGGGPKEIYNSFPANLT